WRRRPGQAAAPRLPGAGPPSGDPARGRASVASLPRQLSSTGAPAAGAYATRAGRAHTRRQPSVSASPPRLTASPAVAAPAPLDGGRRVRENIFTFGYGDEIARARLHHRLVAPVRRSHARAPVEPGRAGRADGGRADHHHRAGAAARLHA